MTSISALSQRDRRTLAAGAIIVSLLFLFARGLPALKRWELDQVSKASAAANGLSLLRVARASFTTLRDTVAARRKRVAALDSTLLSGASTSELAAALASRLGEIADDNAVKVTALQLRPDTIVSAGLARVEVRLTGITDVAGLAGLIRAVEGQETPLVVKDLTVSQPEPAGSDSKPEALRIDVLIAGLGSIRSRSQ
jgi:hypothetical protein